MATGSPKNQRRLNGWGWILSVGLVAITTPICAYIGIYLGAAVGVKISGSLPYLDVDANQQRLDLEANQQPAPPGIAAPERVKKGRDDFIREIAQDQSSFAGIILALSLVLGSFGGLLIGGLVGIAAATLACFYWIWPRMKQTDLFSYERIPTGA